jgi:hypothetical protein
MYKPSENESLQKIKIKTEKNRRKGEINGALLVCRL